LLQTRKEVGEPWRRFFENLKQGHRVAPDNPARRRAMQKAGGRLAYPPRFKKRGVKDGRRFLQGVQIDEVNARINLRKMGGSIRYRKRRDLIAPPKNVSVVLDALGWHISIQTERRSPGFCRDEDWRGRPWGHRLYVPRQKRPRLL